MLGIGKSWADLLLLISRKPDGIFYRTSFPPVRGRGRRALGAAERGPPQGKGDSEVLQRRPGGQQAVSCCLEIVD